VLFDVPGCRAHLCLVYSLYDARPSLENAVSDRFLVHLALGRGT
jgi:hypothetical protein